MPSTIPPKAQLPVVAVNSGGPLESIVENVPRCFEMIRMGFAGRCAHEWLVLTRVRNEGGR